MAARRGDVSSYRFDELNIWRNTSESDLEGEVWKLCTSAPDYEVSSVGRVRVMINKWSSNGRHFWAGKIITQNHSSKSELYLRANLRVVDKLVNFNVHRLIAEAFVPNSVEARTQVNHIDCNPVNNSYQNLEWCTPQENTDHAIHSGRRWVWCGNDRTDSILTESQVIEILERYYYKFHTLKEIGKDFNMKGEYISLIINGKRWNQVFKAYIEVNLEYYQKVSPILSKRTGNNMHKFDERIKEVLL